MKSINENDEEIFQKKINQDRIMIIQVCDKLYIICGLDFLYRQLSYE